MAGGKERELRRRIDSVQNTKKITRAMELIAATRVVKAQQRAREARPYAEQITKVIENLAAGGAEVDHPLLRQAEKVERVGVIVISSDRGLCGGVNTQVSKATKLAMERFEQEGKSATINIFDSSMFCVDDDSVG